jgi:CRISPR-associated protein Cas5h
MTEHIIYFEVKGNYGHFRRPSPNTNKQTYDFPPRTVISGLLSGGLGYESDSYYELFDTDTTQIGIEIINPVSKRTISKNYKSTSDGEYNKTKLEEHGKVGVMSPQKSVDTPYQQTPVEYIRNPHYKFYVVTENDDLFEELKELATGKLWVYTPYLGSSECSMTHIEGGVYTGEYTEVTEEPVTTVVPSTDNIEIESLTFKLEKMVTNFTLTDDEERVPQEYINVYYTQDLTPIQVSGEVLQLETGDSIIVY